MPNGQDVVLPYELSSRLTIQMALQPKVCASYQMTSSSRYLRMGVVFN